MTALIQLWFSYVGGTHKTHSQPLAGQIHIRARLTVAFVLLVILEGLSVTVTILAGQHKGKGGWERFVIIHQNAAAVLAIWVFVGSLLSSDKLRLVAGLFLTEPLSQAILSRLSRLPCISPQAVQRMQACAGPHQREEFLAKNSVPSFGQPGRMLVCLASCH